MSETLRRVQELFSLGRVRVSDHGYDELANDGILARDIMAGLDAAIVIEDYAGRDRGPSVLALQQDADGRPIHVVWGIPNHNDALAVLVTAYRPDPMLWEIGFKQRKKP
jgi:Domain of unknown function (DUF4258)